MSTPPTSVPFDAGPLVEPVDRGAARAFVRQLKATGRMPQTSPVALAAGIVVGAVFLVVFGSTFIGIITSMFTVAASGGGWLFSVAPGLLLVIVAGFVGSVIWGFRTGRLGGGADRSYRLDRFARANAMTWYPSVPNPPLPGMVFGSGHDRVAKDVVRGEHPRFVEFGNYRYETGSGKNETTHNWGYVAVKLSSPLPHIVLDAVGNNSMFGSNLPRSFDRHQRLSLEGDFDRHFALYCPEGYGADALYLFTPDIMARFIDSAAALDVEIVDDWLFLYTQRRVSTLDPATWAWLFSVVGALLGKLDQWERWRDDRLAVPAAPPAADGAATAAAAPGAAGATGAAASALPFAAPTGSLRPPPGVAPQGRRLRQRISWGAVVFFGVVVLVMVLSQFSVFAGILSNLFP